MEAQFYYRNPAAPAPNNPPSIGVTALIRDGSGSLLLEKRADSERWAFIGGALHGDESLTDALIREVKEETGLTVRSIRLFGTFSDPTRIIAFPDGKVKRILTIAYEVEVEPFERLVISEESRELAFVPEDRLGELPVAETHLPILNAYRNREKDRVVLE
ncbi:NUDIX domain-containing protein [Paenibacillus aurantius]|uniref:NUDIX domain-containing protein n=1 Tax=Paenibacillus aurantius TaxID=2918900 RepID=A0AA96LBC2_9BACL|nr:NUDIX domain-containing protein [Paenibacillus aurantius]WNQ10043.1 NUDIX domain-containing protein [Paenibacillus aurantius]